MMANIHLAGMEEDLYSGYDKEDMAPQLNTEDLGTIIFFCTFRDSKR